MSPALADACQAVGKLTREQYKAQDRANTLSHYTPAQQQAVMRLYKVVKVHFGTSGGTAIAKFLLGLYNGPRFPFDLTDLRLLDPGNLEAALCVLQMDAAHTWCEVHVLIDALVGGNCNIGGEFEVWAYRLGLPKRCSEAAYRELAL